LFNDATLNQLVQQALVANQDLQAAIARLAASEAAAREAGAELYPAVGLGASGSRNRTSGETFNGRQSGRRLRQSPRRAVAELRGRSLGPHPAQQRSRRRRGTGQPLRPRQHPARADRATGQRIPGPAQP
jgi:hypothetical protein